MRKLTCIFLAGLLLAGVAGCSEGEPANTDRTPEEPTTAVYAGEGWSFEYDPELFEDSGDMTVTYTGGDSPMPVYLSVRVRPDETATGLAEELALQSGGGTVKVEDAAVGRDGLPARCVSIERLVGEISEVTQYRRFYAMDTDSGCVLLEIASYDGAPPAAKEELDHMLASFTLR